MSSFDDRDLDAVFALEQRAEEAGERGDHAKAVRLWREALAKRSRDPDNFGRWYAEGRLADALIAAGEAREARALLEQSLASGSDIPASQRMLNQLYRLDDDYAALENVIRGQRAEIAQAQAPYYEQANTLLALADRSVDFAMAGRADTGALVVAETLAHEIGNREVEWLVRHRRGMVAEALGDDDRAITAYRTLVDEGSTHEETIERLLVLLEREGRHAEALKLATRLVTTLRPGSLRDSVAKRAARLAKDVDRIPSKSRAPKPITRSTFGARVAITELPTDVLSLERAEGREGRFEALDALTGRLLADRLAGRAIATGSYNLDRVDIPSLSKSERALIADIYSIEHVENRGAWSIPAELRIPGNLMSPSLGEAERGHSVVQGNPEAIYLWAVLDPLYRAIHAPLAVRQRLGARPAAAQKTEWQGVYDVFEELGLDIRLEMDPMRYGGGWSRLSASDKAAVVARLSATLATWAPEAARRYRALLTRDLARAYYGKADDDGRALRSRVVTAALRPAVGGIPVWA